MQIELLSISKFVFRTSAVSRFCQFTCTVEIRYVVLYIGVTKTVRKKMEGILFGHTWNDDIVENTFVAGGTSKAQYGLAAFGRSSDGMFIDCMYIVYKAEFELAPKEIETFNERTMIFGLFNWAKYSTEEKKQYFGIETNKKFENYFRVKVLENLKERKAIDSVSYLDN